MRSGAIIYPYIANNSLFPSAQPGGSVLSPASYAAEPVVSRVDPNMGLVVCKAAGLKAGVGPLKAR